jgi:hypothetical protein
MKTNSKLIVAFAAATLAGLASAQPATGRTAGEATRDAGTAVGRAASAAVTPGDQNMGRTPDNRSGGLMGNNSGPRAAANSAGRAASAAVTPGDQNMGRNPENRSGGVMGSDTSSGTSSATTGRTGRAARADRN